MCAMFAELGPILIKTESVWTWEQEKPWPAVMENNFKETEVIIFGFF